jgi:glycosyltransferase 2 family protein
MKTGRPGRRSRMAAWARAIGVLALTAGFLWYSFRGIDIEAVAAAAQHASYGWILLSLVFLLLSHLLRAWRWRYLLAPLKPDIGLRNLFSGVMIGYLVNNVIPRGGELARPFVVSRLENIPRMSAFGTVVIERLIDTLTFLLLVAFLPLMYAGPLKDSFPWLEGAGRVLAGATCLILAALVVFMIRRDWTDRALEAAARVLPAAIARRVNNFVHRFLDGLLFLQEPRALAIVLVTSLGVWFLYIVMVYVSLFAFGLQGIGFFGAVVVQTISSIGVAMPTPGGTGSYHAFTAQSLTRLFGVDGVTALSFATVTHAAGYVAVGVIGLWYFARDHFSVREALAAPGGTSAPPASETAPARQG